MDISTRDINLIIETLRRNEYKASDIHSIIATAWGEDKISLRRVQEVSKQYKEGVKVDFGKKAGSGTPK